MLLRVEGDQPIRCDIGEHDVDRVAVLSIQNCPPLGCIPCWTALGHWCKKHNQGHQGFADGTSACTRCIEEEVERSEAVGAEFLQEAPEFLSPDEREELYKYLLAMGELRGQSWERCVTRALATLALRIRVPIHVVIAKIRKERSVKSILPWSL